jgi:hypothetical protein
MDHLDHLDWPFFDAHHCALAAGLDAWAGVHLADQDGDVDTACRGLVARLVFAGCRLPASARIGTGGQGSSRARRSNGCTATSARCGSMKAPAKCSN